MAGPLPDLALAPIDSVAHVIQVALTPVFLLTGIGSLLNVFNQRLSRVADHAEHASELLTHEADEARQVLLRAHLLRLRLRTLVLDASVMLGACGGASTCAAAFTLFLGDLRNKADGSWLFVLFGLALFCTVGALTAFLADSLLAWHGLHQEGPLPRPRH